MGTPAPDAVKRLVDRFDQDRKVFLSGDYKEEQLRGDFLDLLFESLGWDMDDTLDTIRARNWGSVPLSPGTSCLTRPSAARGRAHQRRGMTHRMTARKDRTCP